MSGTHGASRSSNMGLIVPAALPSSRKDLEEKLGIFARISSVNRVQIDIVDGHFASPISWPYNSPGELHRMVEHGETLPWLDHFEYEIDLMCKDAEQAVGDWLTLGASRLTFHAESTSDMPRLLAAVRRRYGTDAGFTSDLIALGLTQNLANDFSLIESCLHEVEYIQFMGIAQIGQQGQPFDSRVLKTVRIFRTQHPEITLQVDGGISLENAKELIALGVSNLIIGSVLLRANDPAAVIARFEALQKPYGM